MPPITRAASKRVASNRNDQQKPLDTNVAVCSLDGLGIRRAVTHKLDEVWDHRGGKDVYTMQGRAVVKQPQIDHCLEVQLVEFALAETCVELYGGGTGIKNGLTTTSEWMAHHVNAATTNLNVTSKTINQKKRGPFTALLNRLESNRLYGRELRAIQLEQLARQGKARELVDDGTWARIHTEVVCAYDQIQKKAQESDVSSVKSTMDSLQGILQKAELL